MKYPSAAEISDGFDPRLRRYCRVDADIGQDLRDRREVWTGPIAFTRILGQAHAQMFVLSPQPHFGNCITAEFRRSFFTL